MGSKVPPMTPTRRAPGREGHLELCSRPAPNAIRPNSTAKRIPSVIAPTPRTARLVGLVVGLLGGEHGGGEGAEHALSLPSAPDSQRTCPSPVTTYFVEVISGRPIGPRACSFWVLMPISAPKPNSPPSVNRVDALTSDRRRSRPRR